MNKRFPTVLPQRAAAARKSTPSTEASRQVPVWQDRTLVPTGPELEDLLKRLRAGKRAPSAR